MIPVIVPVPVPVPVMVPVPVPVIVPVPVPVPVPPVHWGCAQHCPVGLTRTHPWGRLVNWGHLICRQTED